MALQKQTKRIQDKIGTKKMESWDSSVGIATGYRLNDQGVGVEIPVGVRIFNSPQHHTGSGAHPTSYLMRTGGSLPRVKRPVLEADHSPPTNAEGQKTWIYTSTLP
jgi:hypothetical protein